MTHRRYTWIPDLPDFRDHVYALATATAAVALPPSVDLRPTMSPVEDQGNLGSCVGHAIAGALECLDKRIDGTYVDVSRLFIYYQARALEHNIRRDDGCSIRDGVKGCAKVGACAEKLWPYKVKDFATKPSAAAVKDAAKHRIAQYQRANTLTDCKVALATGVPVAFGFAVYESFESHQVTDTGTAPMPSAGESELGGHAVLMVGYDDATERVIVRNSWGKGWGDAGHFTLPYAYVEDRNLSDDFWVIRK